MAICEFHDKYFDHLTGRVALELMGKKGTDNKDWGEVWCVINSIAICKTLEQITTEEATNLTAAIYKLYPQYEAKTRQELADKYHWV